MRALEAGAQSYMLKSDAAASELLDAIRKVYTGKRHVPSEVAAQLAEHLGQ